MSNLYWFKHDKNASFNDKMAELLNHEGSKGYGAYWYIIEMIYMQSRQKVHFNYLKSIERHGFSQSYMKKIITCYGLFVVEDDCFYPIISHSSLDNRTSKKTCNEPTTRQQPTHDKVATEDQPTHNKATTEDRATHEKVASEDQLTHDKAATEDQPTHEKVASEHFPMVESSCNSLIISKDAVTPSLARATRVRTDKIRTEKNRTDKINIIIRKRKRKRKKDDDDDDDKLKKRKFQSRQELVKQLPLDSGWGEQIYRWYGYRILLKWHSKEAINQYCNYIRAYGRRGQPCDLSNMHRCFPNSTAAGGYPSKELHKYLSGRGRPRGKLFLPTLAASGRLRLERTLRQAWENRLSSLGKPSVKAGQTVRQSWEDRRSKLGRRALKAGKTASCARAYSVHHQPSELAARKLLMISDSFYKGFLKPMSLK